MVTVVTGFNKKGLEEYGRRSLEAFAKHWPNEVKLVVYLEEYEELPRADEVRLLNTIPELMAFIDKNKNNEVAQGRAVRQGWKAKDTEKRYCYKFDILKFCKQVMYLWDANNRTDDNLLLWLDGDVLTYRDIPFDFITNLVPPNYACSYLGRGSKHSEIGLLAFNTTLAGSLIDAYAKPVIDNSVFELDEWHSAFLFDNARKVSGAPCYNMTPNGRGHVWFQSELGHYMDHLKGDRKIKGISKERGSYGKGQNIHRVRQR
jgi:hypothetical protein